MSIDAMKQALEALLEHGSAYLGHDLAYKSAITALRAAIDQAQEPVAWLVQYPNKHEFVWGEKPQWIVDAVGIEPLYTAPRQWKGLTDEEIKIIWRDIDGSEGMLMRFARAIKTKLREKNS